MLHNHYHVIAEASENATVLSSIIRDIHKFTAMWFRKNIPEAADLKQIWWNYWDSCITYEKSYFARLNYLWYNPQKHELIENAEEWVFGSLFQRVRDDEVYIHELKEKYPFDAVKVRDDF